VEYTGLLMTKITSREISYLVDGVNMKGYLAWDAGIEGPRPGVLVVPEWWGLVDYPRKRADMLAAQGYSAFAMDIYGDGKTATHPQEAQKLMGEVLANLPGCRARFDAARAVLQAQPITEPGKIAAIGYCLGGGVVLHMARHGADLAAVASFHGSLPLSVAPELKGTAVTARVVAYNGEADPFVSAEAIAAFKAEMEKTRADYQFINFPGTLHGFTSPEATANGEKFGIPLKYNELADQSSWAHLLLLLESVFAGKG